MCRQSELTSAADKVREEREFLRSLNETLLSNQKDFAVKLKASQAALADKDAALADLQEQVGAHARARLIACHAACSHVHGCVRACLQCMHHACTLAVVSLQHTTMPVRACRCVT